MVQPRVKFHPVLLFSPFHNYFIQMLIPHPFSFRPDLIKTLSFRFGIKVNAGIFNGRVTYSCFYLQRFPLLHVESEVQSVVHTFGGSKVLFLILIDKRSRGNRHLAQSCHKIHSHPFARIAELYIFGIGYNISLYLISIDNTGIGIDNITTLSLFVPDINYQVCRTCFGKRKTKISYPCGCRQFSFYHVIFKHNGIIPGFGMLRVLVETGTITAVRGFK